MKKARAKVKRPDPALAPPRTPRATLSPKEIARIHARTMFDPRVIKRWVDGGPVREPTASAIERACADLGLRPNA